MQFDSINQLCDPVNQACNLKLELFVFRNELMLVRLIIESGGTETLSESLIYIQNKTLQKNPVCSECTAFIIIFQIHFSFGFILPLLKISNEVFNYVLTLRYWCKYESCLTNVHEHVKATCLN